MKTQLFKAITVVMLLLMPILNFGQVAPPLGAAESFALFTSAGAFDNLGATIVTGDIGSNSAIVTGFPPGAIVGTIYTPPDPTLAQAAIDVGVAYGLLSGMGGTVLGVTLGNDMVLTPGVYSTGAASTLNGDLYLDGQGDPDALFIIRIGGAFATSTFSNVYLINSASLCNVYWQIMGAFTLGDGSVFRGTIVGDGAIHLLEGSSLLGRGLTTAGAIDLHNNLVTINLSPVALVLTGSTICASPGGNGTITSSTSVSGVNYQLYDAGDTPVQTAKAGTGSGLTWSNLVAGTGYYVIATNAEFCTSPSSNAVDVATYANPTITTGGTAAAVCYSADGQTTTLAYSATTNSPNSYSIDWDATANAAGLADQGNTSFTFIAGGGSLTGIAIPGATDAGGPYAGIMTITNADGCTATQAVTVTVNALPAANAGTNTEICLYTSTQIGAAAITGSTYSWTSLPAGFTSSEANPTVAPLVTTTYTVVETITATGCQSSNSVTITVNPCGPPAIPISTWALFLGGILIALFIFIRYRRMG